MRTIRLLMLIAMGVVTAYGQAAIDSLVESLSSENGETRLAAFDEIAAGQYGAEAIGPVAALLDASNPAIAGDARFALEKIVGPLSIDPAARAEVSAALCRAVEFSSKRSAQRWLLWLVSYAGGAEVVPHLRPLLDDESTFDLALFAVQSIGGDAAAAMVSEWMEDAPENRSVACINALGKIGGPAAVAALIREAEGVESEGGLRALDALGTLGVMEAEPALWSQVTTGRGTAALASYLRLAEQQPAATAAALYEKLLTLPGNPTIRCAALTGLGKTGSSDAVEVIVPLLVSQRADVYGAARAALVALQGEDTGAQVRSLMARAEGPLRASLLEVLYRRDPASDLAEVEAALGDANAEVRATAIRLLAEAANPEYESTFLELASSGDAGSRPVALQGYLRLADNLFAEGQEAHALAMYHRALEIATRDSERREALRGLGAIASPETLPILEGVSDWGDLEEDAEACALAIANHVRESDPDTARLVLRRILKQSEHVDLAQRADNALRVMGDSPDVAPKLGFITHWQLIGPFPNAGFDSVYPPENEFDPNARYAGVEGATVNWNDYVIDHVRGVAELDLFLRPIVDVIAYARTVFTVPTEMKAELRLGSDDGVVCWLNGEKIHSNKVDRKVAIDNDRIPVTLRAGENTLLLKIVQGGGGMGYCARFFGEDGSPLLVTDAL